ncbi:MAG: chorismate mutase [Roseibium sp.]
MTQNPENGRPFDGLRAAIDEIDAGIHDALIQRAQAEADLAKARQANGEIVSSYAPDREAEVMRNMVERHHGNLPLVVVEHLWRDFISAGAGHESEYAIHLDGGAELIEILDLARFYFGFSAELIPCSDASDVVGTVTTSEKDIGLVALTDRAELPWWRGLSDSGAQIRARLPFVVSAERPADLPALVLAKSESLIDNADIAVYDARWSDVLPGRLMDQGMEVLSFFRSANGVDALLAVSGDLPEEDVLKACAEAGAAPVVLRRVGGYAAPIDGDSDPEDVFDPTDEGSQG